MKRYDGIKEIISHVKNELIIANIGFPSRELYEIRDREKNFYMLGSMGLCSSIAMGLASAKKDKRVIAIDGDGSVLMNLGTLVTTYNQSPENLILIILDNGAYGSTGNQETYAKTTDILKIAKSIGYKHAYEYEEINFEEILTNTYEEPIIIRFKIEAGNSKAAIIPMTAEEIKNRFINSID